jgi:hypothetical protein
MSDEFREWYERVFSNHPGANEHDNIQMVRRIWNSALETAASRFEFNDFEMLTAARVAAQLREYKE